MTVPVLYKYSPSPEIPRWPTRRRGPTKPVGVWLSVGDAWERWCRSGSVFLDGVRWRRPVILDPSARVLVLDNRSREFNRFSSRYAIPPGLMLPFPDWEQVAADWDVLILDPWERLFSEGYRWDWSWDCPSGVALRPGAIAYGPAEQRISPSGAEAPAAALGE